MVNQPPSTVNVPSSRSISGESQLFAQGQSNRDGCPGALQRDRLDGAPVGHDDLACDGKADPRAGDLFCCTAAPEPVEDVGQLIGGDPGAGVDNVQDRLVGLSAHDNGDLITGAAVACRVGQQVALSLVQPVRVRAV